jgi:nitrogen fixation/metabolism regulation signal transduction histidine kinase
VTPTLRSRLLSAFVLVAVPPLAALALVVVSVVSRRFEDAEDERRDAALRAAAAQIADMRRRAADQVAAIAREDLPPLAPAPGEEHRIAETLAGTRGLPALEIVAADGRIVSSRHFPAGFGLPDKDGLFPGDPELRLETVGEQYGMTQRLALMPARPGVFLQERVTVRGGPFLDPALLATLSGLTGTNMALFDRVRGRWVTPDASPLAVWRDPAARLAAGGGVVELGGATYRFSARALNPGLSLVAATPRKPLESVVAELRGLTLGVAAGALVLAVVAGIALSARIARPVRELSEGARRVAAGELTGSVPATTGDEVGELAIAFNHMTEQLRASREQLLQAERVAAWREMARRLAHELKNPLFPIQLSIETLRRAFEEREASRPRGADGDAGASDFPVLFRESTDTILQELQTLRRTVEEFSAFARTPRPRPQQTDLNALVRQVVALYGARAAAVDVETDLDPAMPTANADPDLLSRALGNLVANAVDAMPNGGRLRIRTSHRPGAVAVEVEDSGPGLTDDQRTRLFTPYYTTKRGGTGLGLAIVQGIVSDHGGRVEVRSEAGRGTAFTLLLPDEPPDRTQSPLPDPAKVPGEGQG